MVSHTFDLNQLNTQQRHLLKTMWEILIPTPYPLVPMACEKQPCTPVEEPHDSSKKCLARMKKALIAHQKSSLSHLWPKQTKKNMYLYGPVGRGKTTLSGIIFDHYPGTKKRFHFDQLCSDLHHHLEHMTIDDYVQRCFQNIDLLWIDELQIYDITMAMILKRLVPSLIKHHHTMLMTGNIDPIDFYKDGLNRDQFEGFIPYFFEHFTCLNLNGDQDYRLFSNQNIPLSHHILSRFFKKDPASKIKFHQAFQDVSPAEQSMAYTLSLHMRSWVLKETLVNAVYISFDELACLHNHSAEDYEQLIKKFPTIFLYDVPIFDETNRDACRRFMAFIDILYDQKGTLFMEAEMMPDQLYQDERYPLPFERTFSRLIDLLKGPDLLD